MSSLERAHVQYDQERKQEPLCARERIQAVGVNVKWGGEGSLMMGRSVEGMREPSPPATVIIKECSICLEVLKGSLGITTLACNHDFHSTCIYKWVKEKDFENRCPECRADLLKVDIDKINRTFSDVAKANSRWTCDCTVGRYTSCSLL